MKKKMKSKCIAFICFGTGDEKFYKDGLLPFLEEGKASFGEEYDYYMAFSSERLLKKIKEENLDIDAISISKLCSLNYEKLNIIPLYLINGSEFIKVKNTLIENFKGVVKFNPPLLDGENDEKVVEILVNMKKKNSALILIGHGSRGAYNLPYDLLKEKLRNIDEDILFTTLNEEKELINFLGAYKEKGGKNIKIVPFLMTLGNHFYSDINGRIYKLVEEMKFNVEVIHESLGMNKKIRRLFLNG